MQVRNLVVGLSLSALTSVAFAGAKKEPNCEVKGKKEHVKDEKACAKKHGTWLGAAEAAAPAAAPAAEAAPAPAAAGGEQK